MKQINFNDFKQLGITLTIGSKDYKVQFIPYPIEKDIYQNMGKLSELFQDMFKITDEQIEQIKKWIWDIISHKKNENEDVKEDLFDELGLTELIVITISLVNFISARIQNMQNLFINADSVEKKTT